tara:strand:- start:134 stop:340 length:207 start_codon:yes stop_codon:yes gene_type:complete
MSLKSFHIVFAVVTTALFIFLTGFYAFLYSGTEEIKHGVISGINLLLTFSSVYYCKKFIQKHKSLSNL